MDPYYNNPEKSVEAFARQNCVSILARQTLAGAVKPPPASPAKPKATSRRLRTRSYTCKSCNRIFETSQALGGHRAGHARYNFSATAAASSSSKGHECAECRLSFATGQALGGHMRSHVDFTGNRKRVEGEVKEEEEEEEEKKIETVPFLDFDLNFPPVDE